MSKNPLSEDLDLILRQTKRLWGELRGQNIFITGGTGFFGCWFLETLAWANEKLGLKASATILTRNLAAFQKKIPHLAANTMFSFHQGDVRNFKYPTGTFSHIIHAAATSAEETFNKQDPNVKHETVIKGTKHTLDFATQSGAKKFLYTSSGVVGGESPQNNPGWGRAKAEAESLCLEYGQKHGIEIKIARCYSFVGPYLPLDLHYAVGNFIGNVLRGESIKVNGDGTPIRSYLYTADLMIWLWSILFKGQSVQPYEVGSERAVSIKELAELVADVTVAPGQVSIAQEPSPNHQPSKYLPQPGKNISELGLQENISLREAITRTFAWCKNNERGVIK